MVRRVYVDPAVERAVREVRRIRDGIGRLVELAEEAREKGRGRDADKILDAYYEGQISYKEAEKKLRALAEAR